MKTRVLFFLLAMLLASQQVRSEQPQSASRGKDASRRGKLTDTAIRSEERLYRKAPEGELYLHVYFPPGWKREDARPAIVLFFGGAWKTGSYRQFVPQAEYFASRGMVAAAADYRIKNKHGTTPDKSVEDAKSAMRWMRSHAGELGVDANKIAAGGGSAGGHLAAATALVDGFNAVGEDTNVSCRPSALVLFNPVLNLTRVTEAAETVAGDAAMRKRLSPTLYLEKSSPPAILFYGATDKFLTQGEEYAAKAQELGVRAELYVAPGKSHGFFNQSPWTEATVRKADEFLVSLGYLNGSATIESTEAVLEKR